VQMTVDSAELPGGFDHPRGAPPHRHAPVLPVLDVLGVLTADRNLSRWMRPVGG